MIDTPKQVRVFKRKERTVCDPLFAESARDFEKIADMLIRNFGAELVDAFDGLDARRWVLRVPDGIIEVHYDDMGGTEVVSMSPHTDAVVERIARALEAAM